VIKKKSSKNNKKSLIKNVKRGQRNEDSFAGNFCALNDLIIRSLMIKVCAVISASFFPLSIACSLSRIYDSKREFFSRMFSLIRKANYVVPRSAAASQGYIHSLICKQRRGGKKREKNNLCFVRRGGNENI
jgi:hypothetical protein